MRNITKIRILFLRNYNQNVDKLIQEFKNNTSNVEYLQKSVEIGDHFFRESKFTEAKEYFLQSLSNLPKIDKNTELKLYMSIIKAYNGLQEFENSIQYYQRIFNDKIMIHTQENYEKITLGYLETLFNLKRFKESEEIISENLSKDLKPSFEAEILIFQAKIKEMTCDITESSQIYNIVLQIAKKNDLKDIEAKCLFNIGNRYLNREEITPFMATSLKIAQESKKSDLIFLIEKYIKDHSIQINFDFLEFYEKFIYGILNNSRVNLKRCYEISEDFQKLSIYKPYILYHYSNSLKITNKELAEIYLLSGNSFIKERIPLKFDIIIELTKIYIYQGKYKKAKDLCEELLKFQGNYNMYIPYSLLGDIYLTLKEYDKSQKYYNMARSLNGKMKQFTRQGILIEFLKGNMENVYNLSSKFLDVENDFLIKSLNRISQSNINQESIKDLQLKIHENMCKGQFGLIPNKSQHTSEKEFQILNENLSGFIEN